MRVSIWEASVRHQFLGCPVDILTMTEIVELACAAMRSRDRLHQTSLNVAKLVNMRRNRILASDVCGSDLITMDGMGIVWGARLLGLPATKRVTGIDLFFELLSVCARDRFRPYFLGAGPSTIEQAAKTLLAIYPTIELAGARDGYFGPEQEPTVVDEIRHSRADCLFIGMPTPKKERFLAAHRDDLGVPYIMGVGGAFDVLAGKVSRAPQLMQELGLEWLYRVYQEPGRMWWRYAKTNVIFAGLLTRAIAQRGAHQVWRFANGFGPDLKRSRR